MATEKKTVTVKPIAKTVAAKAEEVKAAPAAPAVPTADSITSGAISLGTTVDSDIRISTHTTKGTGAIP